MPKAPNLDPDKAPQLTEGQALRCRVLYFVDGLAIGSQAFLDELFGEKR